MVKNAQCGGRPMVIDGRVRAAPDGKSGFALFWLVARVAEKDTAGMKNVNMELKYIEASLKMKIKLDDRAIVDIDKDEQEMPSFTLLVNPKKVNKHTRLMTKEDMDLKKLAERIEKEKLKEAGGAVKHSSDDKSVPEKKKAKK